MQKNEIEHLKFTSDFEFDLIYPDSIRELSSIHWSPVDVVRMAVDWLDLKEGTRLLDIGSGVGKFCCIAGELSDAQIFGVEKRIGLVKTAEKTIKKKKLSNVQVIHANITDIDFSDFDAFYYYNPFCEQIAVRNLIDNSIEYSPKKYREYEDFVIGQLDKLPFGTKVVTYYSPNLTLPDSYRLRNLCFNSQLALWIKTEQS